MAVHWFSSDREEKEVIKFYGSFLPGSVLAVLFINYYDDHRERHREVDVVIRATRPAKPSGKASGHAWFNSCAGVG